MVLASGGSEPRKRRHGRKSGVDGKKNIDKSKKGENQTGDAKSFEGQKSLLVQLEGETWYNYGSQLPGWNATIKGTAEELSEQRNSSQIDGRSNHPSVVSKYRDMADLIFRKEVELFRKSSSRGSDERWVENTMKRGTLKDRIAAMSVTVSSDPIHNFGVLDGLLQMSGCSSTPTQSNAPSSGGGPAGQTNSRVAQMTAEALEDLFLNTLLPSDRKLLTLSQRPLFRYEGGGGKKTSSQKTLSPRILILWRFEEMVKEKYDIFLRKYMTHTLHEGVVTQKIATLRLAATFLRSIPEGESHLLAMIVNKLGDPEKKTASSAGHELRRVLQQHPNMQLVIAREVQQLCHRPHLSARAQYNCIVFLNQLKLSRDGDDDSSSNNNEIDANIRRNTSKESLPASLIKTYFRFFEVAINKSKNDSSDDSGIKSRLLSALLTGINRAHPYLPDNDKDMQEHLDELYRVVHTAAPSASTQALMLLFHATVGSRVDDENHTGVNDEKDDTQRGRFYRALYASLSNQSMLSSGKHLTMYFNLLYKAMKYDTDNNRINAFAKRILCSAIHCGPSVVSGTLFLLNEIAKSHVDLKRCFEDPPDEIDAKLILDPTKREPRAALIDGGKHITSHELSEDGHPYNKVRLPPCWELTLTANHFHPSVAKFANTFGEIDYMGDPLKDFGLAPFLDKFAYRNPKSMQKLSSHFKRGESVAERRSGTEGTIAARMSAPVNDPSFLEQQDVSEQDEFFHKFFLERARRDEIKGVVRNTPSEGDDGREDAEEEAVNAAEASEGWDENPQKSFEEYEAAWETDSEEEAFVDSLAQKLMDDSANGEADFDDEDPDIEEWGDIYDKGKDKGPSDFDKEDSDDNDRDIMYGNDNEENMEGWDDNDDAGVEGDSMSDDVDAFMDDDDSSESGGEMDRGVANGKLDDSSPDPNDLAFVGDSGSDSDEGSDDEEEHERSAKGKAKSNMKQKELPTFADAEEYATMINKGWNDLKRGRSSLGDELEMNAGDTKPKVKKRKKKRHSS